MNPIRISDTLSLPLDAATQTFAFIGRKGSGKTYGAGKLTELLIEHGVQVVILDSVGNWYGLRLTADGRSAGIDIPILGGLRGDVPLEATGSALVADVIVDSGRSVIIDVSQFSKADRQRFATGLGERLWARKKAERDATPLHLVIEESQLIVPEKVSGDTARMVGIYEEIIRLGRNYGIGVSMITQRPQSVSKEVLNQTECLMVFQVNGAHERKALKEWIVHQGMDVGMLAQLPSLKAGDCYVWSPQWLEILKRIHIAPKRTFDSTSTPKAGAVRHRRELKPIDLEDLKGRMAATIEKAKADDPKALRAEIATLRRQLAAKPSATTAESVRVEVPVLGEADRELLDSLDDRLDDANKFMGSIAGGVDQIAAEVREIKAGAAALRRSVEAATAARPAPARPAPARPEAPRAAAVKRAATNGAAPTGDRLPDGERKILTAAAQYPDGPDRAQLSILTGYKRSTRDAYIQRLIGRGFAEVRGDRVVATDDGVVALGDFEPLPVGDALRAYWLDRLPEGEGRVLSDVCAEHPHPRQREAITDSTGYQRSTRDAYLQRLAARRLIIPVGRGEVRAAEELFD